MVSKSTTRRPSSRRRRVTAKPAQQPLPPLGVGETYWVLSVPFREPAPGAKWYRDLGVHVFVGRALPAELTGYRSRPHTWERFIEDDLNGQRSVSPPMEPMAPRPVQVEGARTIARHCAAGGPQFLLADDTGVGKTLTAVNGARAAAKLRGGTRILVIADRPAAITIPAWSRTISAYGDDGLRWCVTTWDRIAKVAGHSWDVVIADEAQALRHPDTKRFAAWVRLSGAARASRRPYQILVSATPGHSPLELPYLGPAFAHAVGEDHRNWGGKDFTKQLARQGLHITKGSWTDVADERRRDVRRVQQWLGSATIHRPAPWGPVPLSGLPVELTMDQRRQYEQEWAVFRQAMNLARRGRDAAKGRAALLRYRQKAGLIRVPQTAEWVAAQVEAGKQVAVSVQYVETAADPLVDALTAAGLKPSRIYGQGRFDVEQERLRFQRGEAPVVVFTPAAAINLHASEPLGGARATSTPRVGVFHQARYSGIQARQVCGRTHRDRQVSPWSVLYAEGTVEESVAKVMVERFAAATDLVGGDTTMLSTIAQLLGADWLPPATLDADDAP